MSVTIEEMEARQLPENASDGQVQPRGADRHVISSARLLRLIDRRSERHARWSTD